MLVNWLCAELLLGWESQDLPAGPTCLSYDAAGVGIVYDELVSNETQEDESDDAVRCSNQDRPEDLTESGFILLPPNCFLSCRIGHDGNCSVL